MNNNTRLYGELVCERGRWCFHLAGLNHGDISVKVVDMSGVLFSTYHKMDSFDAAMDFCNEWVNSSGIR